MISGERLSGGIGAELLGGISKGDLGRICGGGLGGGLCRRVTMRRAEGMRLMVKMMDWKR